MDKTKRASGALNTTAAAAKKIVIELSVIRVNDLTIQYRGGAWSAVAGYSLSDEAETTRRSGVMEYPTSGKATLEDVRGGGAGGNPGERGADVKSDVKEFTVAEAAGALWDLAGCDRVSRYTRGPGTSVGTAR